MNCPLPNPGLRLRGCGSPKPSHFLGRERPTSQCQVSSSHGGLSLWQGRLGVGAPTPDPGPGLRPACLSTQVFGLGNKTYEHFNAMGKYVDKRLEQLGAQRIFELGMGDDDGK